MKIRSMLKSDYEEVYQLWKSIKGFALRVVDDSKDEVERFIDRNPGLSVVAEENGKIVGAILCGHDGRRASLYHVCVAPSCRKKKIGKQMVYACVEKLKKEKINKISIIAFTRNEIGNAFWNKLEWTKRDDVFYYELSLNESNQTKIVG